MRFLNSINSLNLALSTLVLIGTQIYWGWYFILLGFLLSLVSNTESRVHFLILYVCLSILGFTHINTHIDNSHMLSMGAKLSLVLVIAFVGTKLFSPNKALDFSWNWSALKLKTNQHYILTGLIVGSFIIPFYLWHSQAYLNWAVTFTPFEITKLFVGTNGLGIWDELFFINVVFVLLRYHLPFGPANLAQAVLFTSFLFELGFTGWGPLLIFPFALTQAFVYEKTKSLGLVLVLHLILDFILFCSLLYWHWAL